MERAAAAKTVQALLTYLDSARLSDPEPGARSPLDGWRVNGGVDGRCFLIG
jgi:hypothetical protein